MNKSEKKDIYLRLGKGSMDSMLLQLIYLYMEKQGITSYAKAVKDILYSQLIGGEFYLERLNIRALSGGPEFEAHQPVPATEKAVAVLSKKQASSEPVTQEVSASSEPETESPAQEPVYTTPAAEKPEKAVVSEPAPQAAPDQPPVNQAAATQPAESNSTETNNNNEDTMPEPTEEDLEAASMIAWGE